MPSKEELTRIQAINFLAVDGKQFDNYFKNSKEIHGFKRGNRWFFKKSELVRWNLLKESRTVTLTIGEYKKCFEFAIRMVYSSKTQHGVGIRGQRSEMQAADDWVLGILAEFAVRKFLKASFNTKIILDTKVHPGQITAQDINGVVVNRLTRNPKVKVAVKASKIKSCFLVVPEIEVEKADRKSDIYLFARVGLPSDHLFRFLRDHSFIKRARKYLEKHEEFRKIEKLEPIKIWLCGYVFRKNLEKVKGIPSQNFDGYRYVKSVAEMKNSDKDWEKFVRRL